MSWVIIKIGIIDTASIISLGILLSFIFSIIAASLTKFLIYRSEPYSYVKLVGEFCIVAVPFSITGIVSGFLTGISRAPAVTALIPAILTIFGGFIVYLIFKGMQTAIVSGISITVFSASLLLGTIFGSLERQQFDEYKNSLSEKLREVEHELAIKTYRRSFGLPDEIESKKTKVGDGSNSEK
jgi:hypothetical protein